MSRSNLPLKFVNRLIHLISLNHHLEKSGKVEGPLPSILHGSVSPMKVERTSVVLRAHPHHSLRELLITATIEVAKLRYVAHWTLLRAEGREQVSIVDNSKQKLSQISRVVKLKNPFENRFFRIKYSVLAMTF